MSDPQNLNYPKFQNLEMARLGSRNFRPQKILPTASKHIFGTLVPKVKVFFPPPPPLPQKILYVLINCLQTSTATCITFVSGHGVKHIRLLLPYYDEQMLGKNRQQHTWWGIYMDSHHFGSLILFQLQGLI